MTMTGTNLYCVEWSLSGEDIGDKTSHFRVGFLGEALMANTVSATKKKPINWHIIGVYKSEAAANEWAALVHEKQELYQKGIDCNFNRN